jgi:hypothetical protein
MSALRWLAVLPVAVACSIVAPVIVFFLGTFDDWSQWLAALGGLKLLRIPAMAISGLAFIWFGVLMAPACKRNTAMVLSGMAFFFLALLLAASIYNRSWINSTAAVAAALSVLGTVQSILSDSAFR